MKHYGQTIRSHILHTDDDEDGIERTYYIEGLLTPYDPGRSWGPMEDCYPPEGGDMIDFFVTHDGAVDKYALEYEDKINEDTDLFSEIEQAILEAAPDGPDDHH